MSTPIEIYVADIPVDDGGRVDINQVGGIKYEKRSVYFKPPNDSRMATLLPVDEKDMRGYHFHTAGDLAAFLNVVYAGHYARIQSELEVLDGLKKMIDTLDGEE